MPKNSGRRDSCIIERSAPVSSNPFTILPFKLTLRKMRGVSGCPNKYTSFVNTVSSISPLISATFLGVPSGLSPDQYPFVSGLSSFPNSCPLIQPVLLSPRHKESLHSFDLQRLALPPPYFCPDCTHHPECIHVVFAQEPQAPPT